MSQWLSHSTGGNDNEKPQSSYSNGPAEKETRVSNGTTVPTSSTNTAVENPILPLPVTQDSSALTRNRRNPIYSHSWRDYWAQFKRRIGTGTEPSNSSAIGESVTATAYTRRIGEQHAEWVVDGIVDEVVVDRVWTDGMLSSTTPHSECGITPEKSASQQHDQRSNDEMSVEYDGLRKPLAIIRWHTWPFLLDIFSSRFPNERTERHYAQVGFF